MAAWRFRDLFQVAVPVAAMGIWVGLLRPSPSVHGTGRIPAPPAEPVAIDGATLKGDPAARVVLLEWADYECPYCAQTERDVMPEIDRRYLRTKLVQLAYFHHPVQSLHPHAHLAAEAAVCAEQQGLFWEMHHELFRNQSRLERTDIVDYAIRIGVDHSKFLSCLSGPVAASRVDRDVRIGEALDPTHTPTFMVGERLTSGKVGVTAVLRKMQPTSEFIKAIDAALHSIR